MFELRFQFAVPDLLFNEELIDLGRYDRQDLLRLGLRVEALKAWRPQSPIKPGDAPLSLVDCFALAHHQRGTPF